MWAGEGCGCWALEMVAVLERRRSLWASAGWQLEKLISLGLCRPCAACRRQLENVELMGRDDYFRVSLSLMVTCRLPQVSFVLI